ncbi:MAG TPA: heparin lyase I family protein [Polyangia bacterium]|nr:heparin lyase I family protein [Polyangia bacterium]
MTTRRLGTSALALALACTLAVASGCGKPLDLGPDPDFLWWSDHETGGLDDWLRGGTSAGTTYATGGGAISVQPGLARSGRYALVSTAGAAGAMSAGQVTRHGLVDDAYYGAWFYLPATATPATYWVFFSFHADDGNVALWDVKLGPEGASGTLELQLLSHVTGDVTPLEHVTVPLGRWFQVQVFLHPAADASGALRVWLDGASVFDVAGPTTNAAASALAWTVGTITDGLTPAPTTLYVDDAFIAKRRVDTNGPPFWRP